MKNLTILSILLIFFYSCSSDDDNSSSDNKFVPASLSYNGQIEQQMKYDSNSRLTYILIKGDSYMPTAEVYITYDEKGDVSLLRVVEDGSENLYKVEIKDFSVYINNKFRFKIGQRQEISKYYYIESSEAYFHWIFDEYGRIIEHNYVDKKDFAYEVSKYEYDNKPGYASKINTPLWLLQYLDTSHDFHILHSSFPSLFLSTQNNISEYETYTRHKKEDGSVLIKEHYKAKVNYDYGKNNMPISYKVTGAYFLKGDYTISYNQ